MGEYPGVGRFVKRLFLQRSLSDRFRGRTLIIADMSIARRGVDIDGKILNL